MARPESQTDDFLAFDGEKRPKPPTTDYPVEGYASPQEVIAEAAVRAAMPTAMLRRITSRRAIAVIVEVPDASWAADVEQAIVGFASFGATFTRVGKSKANDRPDQGNAKVAACLGFGDRVLGISQSPDLYLPSSLVAAADIRIKIARPSNKILATAIRAATGRAPRSMPKNLAGGLGLDDLACQIRRLSSPAECVRRIAAAAARGQGGTDLAVAQAPPLSELHGYGDAMRWCRQLVHDLDEWRAGRLEWSHISKNVLFHSKPGLGKTSLVRSIARSTGLPLVTTSVSSWFTGSNGHLDGVLKEAHRVFDLAASNTPSILFLDECDAIPDRNSISNTGRDWWLPVINGILLAFDATTSGPTSKVIVIGATNFVHKLDAALVRPGRLHPSIEIRPPDADALAGIMRQHLGSDLTDADLVGVARLAAGMTGAEAVALVRDARTVARQSGRALALTDLMGLVAPADAYSAEDLWACARHEAAHAVSGEAMQITTVRDVTLVLRPGTAGHTRSRMRPRLTMTRAQIDAFAVTTLAGRAQDALTGSANTGSGGAPDSDLAIATGQILLAHCAFGLGGALSYRGVGDDAERLMRDDPILRARVEADLRRLYADAEILVRTFQPAIEALAARLVDARYIDGDEVRRIMAAHPAKASNRGGVRAH